MDQADFKEVNFEIEDEVSEKELAENVENAPQNVTSSDRYISDIIKVQIIPEKKGNFIKHTAYDIRSENHKCSVERRYNDFLVLHDHLLKVYEYRAIPRLPPKQFMLDAFLEERRAGLQRWLIIVCQHAIIAKDITLKHFLTQYAFKLPVAPISEFSEFYDQRSQYLRLYTMEDVSNKQNIVRFILNNLLTLKRFVGDQLKREECQANDFSDMSTTLNELMERMGDYSLKDFSDNFKELSRLSESSVKTGAMEKLDLIIEVLIGYNDACERVLILEERVPVDKTNNMIKNILRRNSASDEDSEILARRLVFAINCVMDEFKLVQKYLKLLPSILLQFTYHESQCFSQISQIFQKILDIETDKLN